VCVVFFIVSGTPNTKNGREVEVANLWWQYIRWCCFGDLWKDVFKKIPAKYRSKSQSLSKQIRAGKALNFYQQGKVRHTAHFPILEEQMWSFPKISHEDVLDAVVSGVLYFLDNKAVKLETKQINYLRRQHV
jgi:hypothetical protein